MNSQICFELLQNNDKIFLNYIFEKNYGWLINLGFYIVNNNFPKLLIERGELIFLAYMACNSLLKVKIDSIKKYGIKFLIRYIMVQKIIEWTRKLNNQKNYIISNYIKLENYNNLNNSIWISYSSEKEIIKDVIKLEIIEKITNKLKKLHNKHLLIVFNQYFLLGFSAPEISKSNNIENKVIVKYINRIKSIIKNIDFSQFI